MNASDTAQHAGGVVFGLVGIAGAIGFMAMITMFYFSIAALLFKGTKAILTPVEEDRTEKITLKYSLPTKKEKSNVRNEGPAGNPRQDSSFFSDVAGVDLEYRGVGVAEDGRASRHVGKTVSKGL